MLLVSSRDGEHWNSFVVKQSRALVKWRRHVDRNLDTGISLSLSVSLHTDAIPTGIIRACSRSPCPSLPPSCQSSPVSLGRNRGSSVVVEIPPWRSGDRGSRGTPPGTRIEHLVAAPDEGSAQEEGSNRGGRDARGGEH